MCSWEVKGGLRWLRLFYKQEMGDEDRSDPGRPCRVLLSFDTGVKQLGKWMGVGARCPPAGGWGGGGYTLRKGGEREGSHVVMARVSGIGVDSRLA